MDYVDIKTHLDKIADELDKLKTLDDFNSRIKFSLGKSFNEEVMVFGHIDEIASTMGIGLSTENYKTEFHDFIAYFVYRGYKFYQFCKHREINMEV